MTRDSLRRDGRRATASQRRWIKKKLLRNPSLYFDEISGMMRRKFGRTITDAMISQALKHDGGTRNDRPLSLKLLTVLARQRNATKRLECHRADDAVPASTGPCSAARDAPATLQAAAGTPHPLPGLPARSVPALPPRPARSNLSAT